MQTDSPEHFDEGTQTTLNFTKPVYHYDVNIMAYREEKYILKSK